MFTNNQLLLQSMREAVFMLDPDGYIQYSNPAAADMTGYSTSELLNANISLLYNIKSDSIKAEYELSLAAKGGYYQTEGWKTKKEDTRFWSESSISAITNEQGILEGFCYVIHNRTEAKQEEIRVRQREEQYRLMVEGVKEYAI